MFPIDMPQDIGSRQWTQWFQKQPPMVQNQVVSTITMSQLNDSVPQSSSAGGYAPELDPQTFGLLDQQGAPPSMDKYGNVQPYDLDVAAKTTNVLQDRNTYLIDNAAAMQAGPGAYNASAFDPIMTPIGQPLQQPGTQLLARYAQSGGSSWQSYIADAMLNRGLDPAAAQAELMSFISAPETKAANPQEQAQRQALIASLPGKAIEDPVSGTFAFTPPDPKNLANTIDVGKIFKWADEGYQKMATDPILDQSTAYQDPATGQWYQGAKAEDSTAAKWYRDRGLALPTDTYTDPDYLDRIAPADIGGWEQNRAMAGQQADAAFTGFQNEKQKYDQMVAAYLATQNKWEGLRGAASEAATQPGGGGPSLVERGAPGGGQPIGRTPTPQSVMGPGTPFDNSKSGGFVPEQQYQLKPGMGNGLNVFRPVDQRYDTVQGKRFQDVSPFIQGPPPQTQGGLDPRLEQNPQRATGFPTDPRLLAEDITSGNWQPGQPAPGAAKPLQGIASGHLSGQLPTGGVGGGALGVFSMLGKLLGGTGVGAELPGRNQAVPTAEDLAGVGGSASGVFGGGSKNKKTKKESEPDWAKAADAIRQQYGRQEMSRQKNSQAIASRRQAQDAPDDVMQRVFAYMDAQNLQKAGRTRLGDQLAQRALAARAAGLYGY
jgi:hypothetical protein